jgi:hypothetical protein
MAFAAFPALALAQAMPTYDPARTCIDAARRAGARDNAASPECIQGETEARAAAERLWPGLSASARSRCTRLADRRQSFLILDSCVEREASAQR